MTEADDRQASGHTPAAQPAIDLQRLTRLYGDTVAVDSLDLTIHRGELFCFLGPNGAGKTTTIRMITGLLPPTSGTVRVAGFDLASQPIEARRRMAYVPDQPQVYEKLTGYEFLQFVGELYQVPAPRRRTRATELLETFGLADAADQLTEGYSHGMKQKIVLAAALIHDPEVIVLDEPTVGLDPRSARLMKDVLRKLCERGTTVFMSTHILEIAERLADRVGIIDRGRLIALGPVVALREQAAGSATLEDVFLRLTGADGESDVTHLLRALDEG